MSWYFRNCRADLYTRVAPPSRQLRGRLSQQRLRSSVSSQWYSGVCSMLPHSFTICLFKKILTRGCVHWFYREKGGRETRMGERNIDQLPPLHAMTSDRTPQPRYVPWLGIELTTFCCVGLRSNQLSHRPGLFLLHLFVCLRDCYVKSLYECLYIIYS